MVRAHRASNNSSVERTQLYVGVVPRLYLYLPREYYLRAGHWFRNSKRVVNAQRLTPNLNSQAENIPLLDFKGRGIIKKKKPCRVWTLKCVVPPAVSTRMVYGITAVYTFRLCAFVVVPFWDYFILERSKSKN